MGKRLIGYMITWTTYGTWLQGDNRGYVKNGQVLKPCEILEQANKERLKSKPIRLSRRQKIIVEKAIREKAKELGQNIPALAVYSNHIHIAAETIALPIEKIVGHYKNAARVALRKNGFKERLWARGFDKRFCFNQQELQRKVKYVERH